MGSTAAKSALLTLHRLWNHPQLLITFPLPSDASRYVLIMYKVLEGEGEVVFRAFPGGILHPPPPQRHSHTHLSLSPCV